MAHSIEFRVAAWKQISGLPKETYARVLKAIMSLSGEPRPNGCKKLQGQETYRIRIGDFRVIYEIHDNVLNVVVIRVGNRREVYHG
jgi:mRNA interferase RelE/StbE